MTEDLLEALLRTALAEKSLDERSLPRFAAALRARAEQILAERVKPLEERAAALEKESAWRAEVGAALEKENAWRATLVAGLEKEKATLEEDKARLLSDKEHWTAESERRQRQIDDLKREREELIVEKRASDEAHERLLEHHRATLRRITQVLEPLPADLPWSYRRARARIAELLLALRKEGP